MFGLKKETTQIWRWGGPVKRDQHRLEIVVHWFTLKVKRKGPFVQEYEHKA